MANVKISQLPEYTGNTSGSWLVMNDSGETTTYKVERETFLSGYAPSGDYATTGSNVFRGNQTITGSISNQLPNGGTISTRGLIGSGTTNLNVSSLNTSSSVIQLDSQNASSVLGYASISDGFELKASNGTGFELSDFSTSPVPFLTVASNISSSNPSPQFKRSLGITGSLYVSSSASAVHNSLMANRTNGNNYLEGGGNGLFSYGGLGHYMGNDIIAYNGGYNNISGSQNNISGPTNITGSLSVSGSVGGANVLNLTGSVGIKNGFFNIRNADDSTAFQYTSIANSNTLLLATTATGSSNSTLTLSTRNTPSDVFNSISFNKDSGSFQMRDLGFPGGSPVTILKINNNISGSNPPVEFKRNVEITGSLNVSGSIIQTGSVQGNVLPLSISSNTASLNLNNGNYFTLQLVSGSATHLNPSNIKPGQTVSVFVNTTGSATMTFPSSIKQISGSSYIPTTTTGLDVLTLISSDSSNLYLVSAKTFI